MSMHIKNKNNIVKFAVTCLFLLVGVIFFLRNKEEFYRLAIPSNAAIVIVVLSFVVNVYFSSLFNLVVMRRFGIRLSAMESFMLSSITAAGNFFLPLRAGTGIRGLYMKRVYQFPISHFSSTLVVYFLITLLFAAIVGMLAIIMIYFDKGYFRLDLFVLFPTILIGTAVMLTLRRGTEAVDRIEISWWSTFLAGYRQIIASGKFLYWAIFIVAMNFLAATIAWMAALQDYAASIRPQEAFLIVVSQVIGGLAALTPGGTGFQELAGIYAGLRFQMTVVELFAVLVWTKTARMIVSLVLALPAVICLRHRMSLSKEV